MEGKEILDDLSSFLHSGIYRLPGSNAVFMDPVRLLNFSYSRCRVSASGYYCRTFHSSRQGRRTHIKANDSSESKNKKKRKRKCPHDLNEQEMAAQRRHEGVRPFLLKAYETLLDTAKLVHVLPTLVKEESSLDAGGLELNFVELGGRWKAPFFEITLYAKENNMEGQEEGLQHEDSSGSTVAPVFNNLICNSTSNDLDAEFGNRRFILPSQSCFHMSDLRQVHDLIPESSDQGFNVIVIDPPWENGSAYQKQVYPTLPSRYFLHLPITQLAHTEGALVVLWMTNRGKLRAFVEKELFPSWGVTYVRTIYWLKIKPDGSLLGDLDLIHHKPYEYLLLGYANGKNVGPDCFQNLIDNQILITIPDHVPGPKPSKCLELFARELVAGWTSWGNEPLHFQDSKYFVKR